MFSLFFSAQSSVESKTLLDSSCATATCPAPSPSNFFARAQCSLCDAGIDVHATVDCTDCYFTGSIGVGGVRLDLGSSATDRFVATVSGSLEAKLALDASLELSLTGRAELATIGYRFGGFSFTVAGIDFDLDFTLGVVIALGYEASARGIVTVVGTVKQPAFTTIIRYGDSTGDVFSSSLAAGVEAALTLAGEATLQVEVVPTIALELSSIIDASISAPLFVRGKLEATTKGFNALPDAASVADAPSTATSSAVNANAFAVTAAMDDATAAATRASALWRKGDCTVPHRLRYHVEAGVAAVSAEAHAHAYALKKWTKGDWSWSIWEGYTLNVLHGCAFPVARELPWTRFAFAVELDWRVPTSFALNSDVDAFLDLVAADLAELAETDTARLVLQLVSTTDIENLEEIARRAAAIAKGTVDAALGNATAAVTKVSAAAATTLSAAASATVFKRLAAASTTKSAKTAKTAAVTAGKLIVLNLAFTEPDPESSLPSGSGKSYAASNIMQTTAARSRTRSRSFSAAATAAADSRSAAAVRSALESALSASASAAASSSSSSSSSSSLFATATVCPPATSCGFCTAPAAGGLCAYCPSSGRC